MIRRTVATAPGQWGVEMEKVSSTAVTVASDPAELGVAATIGAAYLRTTVLPEIVTADGEVSLRRVDTPRYVDKKTLGEGGIGHVALVEDRDIGRTVALKRLKPDQAGHGSLLRFVEEVRVMGQLEHPNIVPVHDVGVDPEGRLYFVMKKIEGETLADIIAKLAAGNLHYHHLYPFESRIDIFASVLQAIAYAHANGVIHRDIKPANVMIGEFGEVALMDWGIAKRVRGDAPAMPVVEATDDLVEVGHDRFRTRQGSLLGTPAYMSPEQARGANDDVREQSDIYALSVLLFELMTLEHPYAGAKSLPELFDAIARSEPKFPSFVRSPHQSRMVPVELGKLILRGMESDPAKRFQSVGEMISALHRVTTGTFPITCHVTALKRVMMAVVHAIEIAPHVVLLGVLSTLGLAVFALTTIVRGLWHP